MKGLLTVILIVLFVPLVLASLWLRSAQGLFSGSAPALPEFFREDRLEELTRVLRPALSAVYEERIADQTTLLSREAWDEISTEILDAPWLAGQLQGLALQLTEWMQGSSEALTLTLPLGEKKERIASIADAALRRGYLQLPMCSPTLDPAEVCRSAEDTYDTFLQRSTNGVPPAVLALRDLPDDVDILALQALGKTSLELSEAHQGSLEGLQTFRSWYGKLGSLQLLLLVAELALLMVIFLLHKDDVAAAGLWIGSALLAAAAIGWVLSSSLLSLVAGIVGETLRGYDAGLSQSLTEVSEAVEKSLKVALASQQPILLLLLLLGLLCCALPFIFRPRTHAGPTIIRH